MNALYTKRVPAFPLRKRLIRTAPAPEWSRPVEPAEIGNVPFVGNIIPPSLAGAEPPPPRAAERARDRRRAASSESTPRQNDEAELTSASGLESSRAVRSLKGNADEEAHDDRSSQGYYTKQGDQRIAPANQHRLDVSG